MPYVRVCAVHTRLCRSSRRYTLTALRNLSSDNSRTATGDPLRIINWEGAVAEIDFGYIMSKQCPGRSGREQMSFLWDVEHELLHC